MNQILSAVFPRSGISRSEGDLLSSMPEERQIHGQRSQKRLAVLQTALTFVTFQPLDPWGILHSWFLQARRKCK